MGHPALGWPFLFWQSLTASHVSPDLPLIFGGILLFQVPCHAVVPSRDWPGAIWRFRPCKSGEILPSEARESPPFGPAWGSLGNQAAASPFVFNAPLKKAPARIWPQECLATDEAVQRDPNPTGGIAMAKKELKKGKKLATAKTLSAVNNMRSIQ